MQEIKNGNMYEEIREANKKNVAKALKNRSEVFVFPCANRKERKAAEARARRASKKHKKLPPDLSQSPPTEHDGNDAQEEATGQAKPDGHEG